MALERMNAQIASNELRCIDEAHARTRSGPSTYRHLHHRLAACEGAHRRRCADIMVVLT